MQATINNLATKNLHMARTEQPSQRYNIQSVLFTALQQNNTLRLDNKHICNWFYNLPVSTKNLLIMACNKHDIKIVH